MPIVIDQLDIELVPDELPPSGAPEGGGDERPSFLASFAQQLLVADRRRRELVD